MNMKRFEATDMAQACDAIRTELGPEAVIISSRKIKASGMQRFRGTEMVEVIAGVPAAVEPAAEPTSAIEGGGAEPEQDAQRRAVLTRARAALRATADKATHRAADDGAAALEISAAAHQAAADAVLAAAREAATGEEADGGTEADEAAASAGVRSAAVREREGVPSDLFERRMDELQRELAGLRRLIGALDPVAARPEGELPDGAQALVEEWRAWGLSEALLQRTCDAARELLDENASAGAARDAMRQALLGLLPSAPAPELEHGKTAIIQVVGAVGSGKTVAAVKLALWISRGEGHPAVLANADTRRPGAGQQLAAYGEALGLPTANVYEASDLKALAVAHPGAVIVLDSPGQIPRDAEALKESKALSSSIRRRQVYLTIDATTKGSDLERVYASYRALPLTGLILTKADETDRCGEAVSFLSTAPTPLIYCSDTGDVLNELDTRGPAGLLDRAAPMEPKSVHAEPAAS